MRTARHVRRDAAFRHPGGPASVAGSALVLTLVALLPAALTGQQHEHDEGEEHGDHDHAGLHFTHPLFTESVSPDTKLRFDYGRAGGDPAENETEVEGEIAFSPAFSIEAGIHYHLDEGEVGDTHVLFKLASPALAQSGVHLGGGLEVGIPTGPGHAHEPGGEPEKTWEVAPFVNAGWTDGIWELVAWSVVGVPTNSDIRDAEGTALRLNASLLAHAGARVDALVEAFGTTALSGSESPAGTMSIAPGLRVRPFDSPLVVGAGVAWPVSGPEDHARLLVSAFWHF
jgi:hypothetical protein